MMDLAETALADADVGNVQLTEAGLGTAGNVSVGSVLNFVEYDGKHESGRNILEGNSDASLPDLGLRRQDALVVNAKATSIGDDDVAEITALEKFGVPQLTTESSEDGAHVVVHTSDGDSGSNLWPPLPALVLNVGGTAANDVQDDEDINVHAHDGKAPEDVSGGRGSGVAANGLENDQLDDVKATEEGSRQSLLQLSTRPDDEDAHVLSSVSDADQQLEQVSEPSQVAEAIGIPSAFPEEDTDSPSAVREEHTDGEGDDNRKTAVSATAVEDRLPATLSMTTTPPDRGVSSRPQRRSSGEGFVALDQLATILSNRSPTPKSIVATANAPIVEAEYDDNDDDDCLTHEYTGLPQDEDTAFSNSELTWEESTWHPRSSFRDEQFFDVSLKENPEGSSNVDGVSQSFPLHPKDVASDVEPYIGVAQEDPIADSLDSAFKGSIHRSDTSSLNSSLSFDGMGSYPPFLGPAERVNRMEILPDASPELMHLIEAAVQGTDSTSLEILRGVVSGKQRLTGDHEKVSDTELSEVEDLSREAADVARVVVDILLAKMAGTDELDLEGQHATPRIMLSAGASVVSGKLLPWLPTEDEEELFTPPIVRMSPRTKLAKGLAVVLQSCTRNRAMCSAAGLMHVLLCSTKSIMLSETEECRKV